MARACGRAASCSPRRCCEPDVTIGMSFSGALTPAGLGCSSIVPLIKAGFVDWIVATGRQSLPRHAFRAELPGARGQLQDGRHRTARQRHRARLRRAAGLQRLPDGHRRDSARHSGAARVSEGDGHRRAALPDRANTAPNGSARPGSRMFRCWPRRIARACRATRRRRAIPPSA